MSARSTLGVLIVGGNGFLGSHLARSLRKHARVTTTYLQNRVPLEGVLSLPIDVRDSAGMRRIIYAQKPDAIVYLCGSENSAWVDGNAQLAEKTISSSASDVLNSAGMISAKFIYISSSSVFDGMRGNYKESDNISPSTLLGRLKAGAENLIRSRTVNAAILRLSPLVGSANPWRPSFFDRLRAELQSGAPLEYSDEEYHSWLPVSDAVLAIENLIKKSHKDSLYHLGGLTRLTPYEMAHLFAKTLGCEGKEILKKKKIITKGMIPLPEGAKLDFSLNSSEIIRSLDVSTSPIEETLLREFQF